jgi:hypothetical protein
MNTEGRTEYREENKTNTCKREGRTETEKGVVGEGLVGGGVLASRVFAQLEFRTGEKRGLDSIYLKKRERKHRYSTALQRRPLCGDGTKQTRRGPAISGLAIGPHWRVLRRRKRRKEERKRRKKARKDPPRPSRPPKWACQRR